MSAYAGQRIGNLVLQEKIGEGGMGSIWIAEHATLGRQVAVKFVSGDGDPTHPVTLRFQLEARTIARIVSPHVPQVFDHGIAPDGTPYIVMELVAGTHLRSWVEQHGPFSARQAMLLMEQAARALTAVHELGIIHRDIKPENLLLSGEGDEFHLTLIDFGIAKTTGPSMHRPPMTLSGMTLGTASYMSPEQLADAGCVDERADLWSLAVVVYWALSGRLPFHGETFADVAMAVTRAQFRPVTDHRPDLPPALDAWFRTALAPVLASRFESARSMTDAFAIAVASDGSEVATADRVSRFSFPQASVYPVAQSDVPTVPRPKSRGRALDVLAVLVIGGFIFGSASLWSTTGQSTQRPATHEATPSAPVPSVVVAVAAGPSVPVPVAASSDPAWHPAATPIAVAKDTAISSSPGTTVTVATPRAQRVRTHTSARRTVAAEPAPAAALAAPPDAGLPADETVGQLVDPWVTVTVPPPP